MTFLSGEKCTNKMKSNRDTPRIFNERFESREINFCTERIVQNYIKKFSFLSTILAINNECFHVWQKKKKKRKDSQRRSHFKNGTRFVYSFNVKRMKGGTKEACSDLRMQRRRRELSRKSLQRYLSVSNFNDNYPHVLSKLVCNLRSYVKISTVYSGYLKVFYFKT